jgi:hypothetical protein
VNTYSSSPASLVFSTTDYEDEDAISKEFFMPLCNAIVAMIGDQGSRVR